MTDAITEFLGFLAFAIRVLVVGVALWFGAAFLIKTYITNLRARVAEARAAECHALADRLGVPREGCR